MSEEAGVPTQWDVAFREGYAKGLEQTAGIPYRQAWLQAGQGSANTVQNERGQWVPSIPLPFYGLRKRCRCGRRFWSTEGYEGHYALRHILEPHDGLRLAE